jgi:uncharacterized protein YjeT (DUF2065 family)
MGAVFGEFAEKAFVKALIDMPDEEMRAAGLFFVHV